MRTIEELEALLDEKRRTIDGAHALVMRLTESLEQAERELETVKRENTRFREWYRNAFGGAQKRETPWEVCNCEQCESLRRLKETP